IHQAWLPFSNSAAIEALIEQWAGNCSRGPLSRSSEAREGAALEGQADGVEGSDGSSSRGFDDRSNVGIELRAPLASKAVGYLSIDRAGAQRPLRAVVCGFEVPVGDEDEEMAADRLDGFLQLSSGFVGRLQAKEAIEPPVQVAQVDFEGAVGQPVAPPSDGAGALEQALQARREQSVAFVDDVLGVADQMGQAKLMVAL